MTAENEIVTECMQNEGGKIIFAPDVVATIAGLAAADIKGITSMSSNVVEGFTEMFGKKNLTKGVKVEIAEDIVCVDLNVVVEYGYRIHEVCAKVQSEVKNAIETMTGLRVAQVNVAVQSISFAKTEPAVAAEPADEQE